MNELKVFVMDLGWTGNIVVIEKDEKSARLLMEKQANYDSSEMIEVFDLSKGLVITNYGDM